MDPFRLSPDAARVLVPNGRSCGRRGGGGAVQRRHAVRRWGGGTAGNAMLWAVSFSDWATDEGQQTVRFWGSRSGEGLELAPRWPPFIGQRSRSRSCGGLRAAAERGKKGFAQRGAFFSIGTQDILDMVGLALPHPRAMARTRCASSGMAVAESGPFSGWDSNKVQWWLSDIWSDEAPFSSFSSSSLHWPSS